MWHKNFYVGFSAYQFLKLKSFFLLKISFKIRIRISTKRNKIPISKPTDQNDEDQRGHVGPLKTLKIWWTPNSKILEKTLYTLLSGFSVCVHLRWRKEWKSLSPLFWFGNNYSGLLGICQTPSHQFLSTFP